MQDYPNLKLTISESATRSVPRLLQCISAPRLSEIRLELLFGTAYQRVQALRVLDYQNVARHSGSAIDP